MGRILEAEEILFHFKDNKKEVKQMVANNEFDYLRVTMDKLLNRMVEGGSRNYDNVAINNMGDFIVMLPDDLAFSMLKDLAIEHDLNERLLLKRTDIFNILKIVRKNG